MAEGPNVGKVSVKVQPDTSRFHRTLKRQLERGNDNYRIPIDADLDTKSLKAKLEKFTEEFGDKVKIPVVWDTPNTAPKLPPGKKTKIPVEADTDLFKQRLLAELRQKTRNIEAKIPLTVDGEKFRLDLADNVKEMERRIEAFAPDLTPGLTAHSRQKLERDMDDLRSIEKSFVGIGSTGGPLRSASNGLGMMSGNLALVAAVALAIPPVLAVIAGTATLIPAALTAVAAPIGAIALGLDGMKQAAVDSGLAIGEIGKDGKLELKGLGKNLEALKTIVSDTFTKGLTPALTDLNNAMPNISMQMETLAKGMSSAFSGITDAIASDEGMNNIQKSVQNLGVAFEKARPGIRDFTNGLLELAGKVSERFPGMGDAFSRMGDKFLGWVDKFTTADPSTGVSKLDTTLTSLKATWDQIAGLGGDLFSKGLEWISDPNFGANMSQFFADVRTFVTSTLPALGTGFQQFATSINQIMPAIQPIITVLEKALALKEKFDQLQNLNPTTWGGGKSLIDTLRGKPTKYTAKSEGFLDQLLGRMGFGPTLPSEAQTNVQASGEAVTKAYGAAITGSAEAQKAALKSAFTPTGVSDAVKGQISTQMNAAITEAQASMSTLGPALQVAIDNALAPLVTIPQKIIATFSGLGGMIVGAMGPVVAAVVGGGQQILTSLSATLANLPQIVVSAFAPMQQAAATALQEVVTTVITKGGEVVAELQSWPGKFQAALGDLSGALVSAGENLVQGLINGINNRKGAAVAAASEMAAAVAAASRAELGIRSPSKVFHDIGVFVGQGLTEGLDAEKDNNVAKAQEIAQSIRDGMQKQLGPGVDLDTHIADQLKSLKAQIDTLELQRANLAADYKVSKDGAVKAQLDEVRAQKEQLTLQSKQLRFADKYSTELESAATNYGSIVEQAGNVPMDFATATSDQFMSDLGISGDGALTSLAKQGLQWGSQFVFNVSDMDSALGAKDRITNQQSLQMAGR